MGLNELVEQTALAGVDDATRLGWTEKLVQRTFGVAASELGTVAMVDGDAVLQFDYNGSHTLTWKRIATGVITWTLDGKRFVPRDESRALVELKAALDS